MDFGANKTTVEVFRERAFGGSYFRDIYSTVNANWYQKSRHNFISWKILIISIIAQIMDIYG